MVALTPLDALAPAALVPDGARIVVVAPHPDDELLALGATIAELADAGHPVHIVAVTDGEASHPASRRWTPEHLRAARARERADALARIGVAPAISCLHLPDGGLPAHEARLASLLEDTVRPGDLVLVPWRHDGHADHETAARAALAASDRAGARCVEFPVWALVPGHPAHAVLHERARLRAVTPAGRWRDAKRAALAAYRSQTEPDGATPPVLPPHALEAWCGDMEWVIA